MMQQERVQKKDKVKAVFWKKKQLLPDIFEFTFTMPIPFEFLVGQYIFLTLNNLITPDPRGPRRHFSIASSSDDKKKINIITTISGSGFKQTLASLRGDDRVDISQATGDLVLPESASVPLVFIAGGMGIVPLLSMIREVSKKRINQPMCLIYSGKGKERMLFLDELTQMSQTLPKFSFHPIFTDENMEQGKSERISSANIQKYVENINDSYFYIVGPEGMGTQLEEVLFDLGVQDEHIFQEDFTGY